MLKIEIEGTDGSSKTTSLKYLVEQAQKLGLNVVETREVGNPHIPACVGLRQFVLDPNSNLSGEAMESIFAAMRFENDKWLANLANSNNPPDLVISDRGALSHLSYTDHNVSKEFTESFYLDSVMKFTNLPDVVIYLSINTETALKRRIKRGETMDVIEQKGVEFQEKVRQSFENYLAEITAIDVYEVNANLTLEEVRAQLDEILVDILNKYEILNTRSQAW